MKFRKSRAEGDAKNREDITFLGELPLFDGQGQVK